MSLHLYTTAGSAPRALIAHVRARGAPRKKQKESPHACHPRHTPRHTGRPSELRNPRHSDAGRDVGIARLPLPDLHADFLRGVQLEHDTTYPVHAHAHRVPRVLQHHQRTAALRRAHVPTMPSGNVETRGGEPRKNLLPGQMLAGVRELRQHDTHVVCDGAPTLARMCGEPHHVPPAQQRRGAVTVRPRHEHQRTLGALPEIPRAGRLAAHHAGQGTEIRQQQQRRLDCQHVLCCQL